MELVFVGVYVKNVQAFAASAGLRPLTARRWKQTLKVAPPGLHRTREFPGRELSVLSLQSPEGTADVVQSKPAVYLDSLRHLNRWLRVPQ